jgi:hypothetical protein
MLANFPKRFGKSSKYHIVKLQNPRWMSNHLSLSATHIAVSGLLAAVGYGSSVDLETAELYPTPCKWQQPHV